MDNLNYKHNGYTIEREEFNRESIFDHRKKVNCLVISYYQNNQEYRKRIEFPKTYNMAEMLNILRNNIDMYIPQ